MEIIYKAIKQVREKMSLYELIGSSLTGGILTIVALLTPGWFGTDFGDGSSMWMNVFYARVCLKIGQNETCSTISLLEDVSKEGNSVGVRDLYHRLLAEGIVSLIGILVGGIFTVIFGVTYPKRHECRNRFACIGIFGLAFTVIGVICGGALVIEIGKINSHFPWKKWVPYSLIMMCVGLVIELLAIAVHTVALITIYRPVPIGDIDLTPAINESGRTVSSTPYTRFE